MKRLGFEDKISVLVCCSGSVASLKIPKIVSELIDEGFDVKVVLTSSASFFFHKSEAYNRSDWVRFTKRGGMDMVYFDDDEWSCWNTVGNPVLHIELRKWADILLVCPASADIMAKIVTGVSDNLLLSVVRAWEMNKPHIICPAMNTIMWEQNITYLHIETLKSEEWDIVYPVSKLLACNDKGVGALADTADIVNCVIARSKEVDLKRLNRPLRSTLTIPLPRSKVERANFQDKYVYFLAGIVTSGVMFAVLYRCINK